MDNTEILTLRHGLWTHVARRKHTPERVYFGAERELMLYGTVRYVLRNHVEAGKPDEEIEVPWAGRVVFDEKVEKMRFYQVYLVILSLSLFPYFISLFCASGGVCMRLANW